MFDLKKMYRDGLSYQEIARLTGYDRRTVKRWVHSDKPPRYERQETKPGKLTPYHDYIISRVRQGVTNSAKSTAKYF